LFVKNPKPEKQINKQTEYGKRILAGKKSATKYDKFGPVNKQETQRQELWNKTLLEILGSTAFPGNLMSLSVCVFKCKSSANL